MLFVSKNCSLEKVAFMNSSCFIICQLNWIVFMAIVEHFRVKMRLASFCFANLIKYKYTFCLVSLLFSLTSNGVESHCNANGVLVHLMLLVSIKYMLRWKKDSVIFSAFVNYNVMLCIEFSSLRLKCDTGGYFYSEYLKGIRVIFWEEFSFLCSKWTIELGGGDFIG